MPLGKQAQPPQANDSVPPLAESSFEPLADGDPQVASRALQRVMQPSDGSSHSDDVLMLQRTLGNQAVAAMVNRTPVDRGQAPIGREGGLAGPRVTSAIERQLGSGQTLNGDLQSRFEGHFGTSLQDVRVHTGPASEDLNAQVGARAFTVGADIFLGSGASQGDQATMAHELTHVVQQRSMTAQGPLTVGRVDDPLEHQADQTAYAAQSVGIGPTSALGPGGGQRMPIQRFVGPEHAEIGDSTNTTIDLGNGVVLTWGQVLAIAGDEYGSVEELRNAADTEAGRQMLRARLEHDRVPGTAADHLPAYSDAQWKDNLTHFQILALHNTAHFPDAGGSIDEWTRHHTTAIESAMTAGVSNKPSGLNDAYLNEAFGQHFLTDSFSGGHIRTPRTQMVNWYVGTFAPRVVNPLVTNVTEQLIDALVAEASPQTSWPDAVLRYKIGNRVRPEVTAAIDTLGGAPKLAEWIGLGIAGAISGAMHDEEGIQGVMVASEAHPEPWRAFGDEGLLQNVPASGVPSTTSVSLEQSVLAVNEAKAQVDQAYRIGEEEGARRLDPGLPAPQRVYFAFDSSALSPEAEQAAATAASILLARPEAALDLVGHADPLGSDDYNDGLGMRRAEAVASAIMDRGVEPVRLKTESQGRRALVTTNSADYSLNRRTEFTWRSQANPPTPANVAELPEARAMDRIRQLLGPPYQAVLRYVPRPVEEQAQASVPDGNAELPEWHWGRLDASLKAQVDDYIRKQAGETIKGAIAGASQLHEITESGVTVHPRDAVTHIIDQLLEHPTDGLGNLAGEPPSQ